MTASLASAASLASPASAASRLLRGGEAEIMYIYQYVILFCFAASLCRAGTTFLQV